ncbi:MAG: MarR family winged helix-turn-helix transcriptional regulator [Rhodoglobus sp.]
MATLTTRFAHTEDSTGLLLWQVTNAWQATTRASLKPFGLTHVQFVLLASITWIESSQVVTQHQLARQAGTDPMMTSQVLRALEGKKLIERQAHPTDRRALSMRVTAAGRTLANRAVVAVEASDDAYFASLGSQCAAFTDMLRKLSRPQATQSNEQQQTL